MARPKQVIRSVYRNIGIPEDLCARMDLELYSDLEGKIPFGAQQRFITMLLRQHFDMMDAANAAARPATIDPLDNPEVGA